MNSGQNVKSQMWQWCYSLNVEGNWADLQEKNSQPGGKINANFRLSCKWLNHIIIKTLLKHLAWFEHQNYVMLVKVSI